MKKNFSAIILALVVVALAFFSIGKKTVRRDFFAMDTVVSLNITGADAIKCAKDIEEEIMRLHHEFSVNGKGAVYSYNESKKESEELSFIISESEKLRMATNGAFDVGIYPVTKLWGFTTDKFKVPTDEEIKSALSERGTKIDLGAIAKGYGADRVREMLSENKIKDATVSLGGTVLLYGDSEKTVAIASPDGEGYAGYIKAKNTVISTSGGYERYFSDSGKKYSHIINPETGYPAKSGIVSATVISERGTESDAFSTAIFVMGEERAKALWENECFGLVLITEDDRIIITEDIYPFVSGIDEKYETEIWKHE